MERLSDLDVLVAYQRGEGAINPLTCGGCRVKRNLVPTNVNGAIRLGCPDCGWDQDGDEWVPYARERVEFFHSSRPKEWTMSLVCPRCGQPDGYRIHLPSFLRPLRLVGLQLRAYRCESCHRRSITREPLESKGRVRARGSAGPGARKS